MICMILCKIRERHVFEPFIPYLEALGWDLSCNETSIVYFESDDS